MSKNDFDQGEALNSPFGRLYFCPETEQIMNCAMFFKYPIDVQGLKKAFSNSTMIEDPRFCSLLVRNPNGEDHWKRVHVNIDDHFILRYPTTITKARGHDEEDDDEATVNAYLADLAVSTPLSKNKPLWEVHVLVELKCVVLRVHHSLGDGVSMMSMLSSCFGQKKETKSGVNGEGNIVKDGNNNHARRNWKIGGILGLIQSMWFTIVFGLRFLGRVLGVKDKFSVISGGDGVELWPRKLVTAKFKIEDFKSIKTAVIPNVTVNDVLLGVISHGLSKYIDDKSPKAVQQALQLSFIIPVHLRKDSSMQEISDLMKTPNLELSGWGNKSSAVIVPIDCCNGLKPLEHVKQKKSVMDKMKHSCCAHFTFKSINFIVSCLGPKVVSWSLHKLICHTTLSISNIVGPSEDLVIGDNPVTDIKVNMSSTFHAITMLLVSYAEKVNLQVMIAKDIIPDPELIVKCFQDSFQEMRSSSKMKLQVQFCRCRFVISSFIRYKY
ncbi:O-acyltransferase WSD1-like isoform X3 [Chenopodium quinoa]|uniref:O-acyltransferase WSD1-like isoform X3 n=1 Tax=Chenopodium quinoa TaxID=63459 RepID=UPI000B7832C3|nr:O-acyltransferase WSD1-like isoform X3 [Chenopodium quinoa]